MSFKQLMEWLRGDKAYSTKYKVQENDLSAFYRRKADHSDERARKLHIDPPRPGRKTYLQRYRETNEMSTDKIKATIAQRESQGKECGVLYRVLSDRLRE